MSFRVGVGIVSYNRKELVSGTIDQVRALTQQSDTALVVADDGSSDGTLTMLRDKQVPVITGVNMGIAWNKNRALYLLSHVLRCRHRDPAGRRYETKPVGLGSRVDRRGRALGSRQLRARLHARPLRIR